MTQIARIFAFSLVAIAFVHGVPQAVAQKKDEDLAKARKHINELEKRIDNLEAALKKAKNANNADDKRIANLAQDVKEREKKIDQLEAALQKAKAANNGDDKRIKQLTQEVKERDAKLAALEITLQKTIAGNDGERKAQQLQKKLDNIINERKNEQLIHEMIRKDSEKLKRDYRDLEAMAKANAVHTAFYRIKKDAPPAQVDAFLVNAPKIFGKLPGVRGLWVGRPTVRGLEQAEYDVGVVAIFDDPDSMRTFLDHPVRRQFLTTIHKSLDPVVYNLGRE